MHNGGRHDAGRYERVRAILSYCWALLEEYGLDDWSVELNRRAKARGGCCNHTDRIVDVSDWHVTAGEWADVIDTCRHEVAHAITGPSKGHGPEWKRNARLVGARTKRCMSAQASAPAQASTKWAGTCDCAHVPQPRFKRHRLSRRIRLHGKCPLCKARIIWTH